MRTVTVDKVKKKKKCAPCLGYSNINEIAEGTLKNLPNATLLM